MSVDDDGDSGNFLDIALGLDLKLGSMGKTLKDIQAQAARAESPVFSRYISSGIVPASGFLVLGNGASPTMGHVWYIRSIAISSTAPGTIVDGRADVFVSAQDLRNVTNMNLIGMQDWRDQATSLPNIAFYGKGELPLHGQEQLAIVLSGGTLNQNVVAGIQFEQFQEAASVQEYNL